MNQNEIIIILCILQELFPVIVALLKIYSGIFLLKKAFDNRSCWLIV
jgi:hypothetical protein